jgi:hypothetical protein
MSSCNKINDLKKMCDCLNGQKLIDYKLAKTGGNDPTLSKAMRYSQYVKNSRSQNVSYTQYYNFLSK